MHLSPSHACVLSAIIILPACKRGRNGWKIIIKSDRVRWTNPFTLRSLYDHHGLVFFTAARLKRSRLRLCEIALDLHAIWFCSVICATQFYLSLAVWAGTAVTSGLKISKFDVLTIILSFFLRLYNNTILTVPHRKLEEWERFFLTFSYLRVDLISY